MKTIVDIIILVCFLGSFVFIVSDVLLYYLLKPRKKQKELYIVSYIILLRSYCLFLFLQYGTSRLM